MRFRSRQRVSVRTLPQSQRHTRDTLEKTVEEEEEEEEWARREGESGNDRRKRKRIGGRERGRHWIACACMRLHRHQRTADEHHSRLLSIHARRRPIVRRVDNFKTMPTGPAAHCAKITGTPVKREQKRRGRNEGGWVRSFVRSPEREWMMVCAFILY